MKNYTKIVISGEDYENPRLLIIINVFSKDSVYLKLFNTTESTLIFDGKIKNKRLLNIIDALLVEAKEDEYNLVDSDYSEIYTSFANLIFYWVSSEYFKATLIYSKIKLKHLMEYTK